MKKLTYKFSTGSTDVYVEFRFSELKKITDPRATVLITDENIYASHVKHFKGWNTIILKPGEEFKTQATVDAVIEKLIEMESDRSFTLVGVGGGVVTDLTGYVASIYMRGLRFGFVPTSILALVDASIGGKNGVDVAEHKNMVGLIRQPAFILHDLSILSSLPEWEWINGFAEVIKHACIRDREMFDELSKNTLQSYQKKNGALSNLIERNVRLKAGIVKKDEFEKNERRLLNFGHTLGHALETQYELMHGEAISIGMTYAAHISEQQLKFRDGEKLVKLISRYGLPTYAAFNKEKVFSVLKMDKKRSRADMNIVLLERIGKAVVKSIPLKKLEKIILGL